MRRDASPSRRQVVRFAAGAVAAAAGGVDAFAEPSAGDEAKASEALRASAPARVFVTGSSDGLGLEAARLLIRAGHRVVLHGRNPARAKDAMAAAPGAQAALVGDVSLLSEARALAEQANASGAFDAVIHNVGIGYQEPARKTADGIPHVFAVNTLAPYVLTALITRPKRLVYLTSGLHRDVTLAADDLTYERRAWDPFAAYSETKLEDILIAFAVARRWPDVRSNTVEPGWVATKLGGSGGTVDLVQGARTQAWLAVSDDPGARVSGRNFAGMRRADPSAAAHDVGLQDALVTACRRLSGVELPA